MTWQLEPEFRKKHYSSNRLCLSKDNISASTVCYCRDFCTVIGRAPVISPHGLFLKHRGTIKTDASARGCDKIHPGSLEPSSLSFFLRHSKLLQKQVDDIVVYEDLTGEVRFSKHLPNPHNLNKWVPRPREQLMWNIFTLNSVKWQSVMWNWI